METGFTIHNTQRLSLAQRGYLYANKPELAKEFEKKTPKGKKLPRKKKTK